MTRIEEIKQRLEGIKSITNEARAPWEYSTENNMIWGADGDAIVNYNSNNHTHYFEPSHGEFIANAPDDIEYLLSEIDKMQDVIKGVTI